MSAVLELLSILVLPLSTARRAGTVAPRVSIAISALVQPIGPRGDDCSAPAGCGVRRRIERKVKRRLTRAGKSETPEAPDEDLDVA